MAYSFNGNDLESCRALCENFYNSMFDEEGHVNTFNSNESGELTGEYLGATKDDFYYYRGYAIQENNSSAVNDFSTYGCNCRLPYHLNDDIVRPFLALKHYTSGSYSLFIYIGCKDNTGYTSWNFNSSRYGNENKGYPDSLFNNTNYCLTSAYLDINLNGENSSATIANSAYNKNYTINKFYDSNFEIGRAHV